MEHASTSPPPATDTRAGAVLRSQVSSSRSEHAWWRVPAALATSAVSVFTGVGWLYLLFKAGVAGWGPHLGGALPLQQLAGTDDQGLVRVAAGWLPAGAIAGVALAQLTSWRSPGAVAGAITVLLLVLMGAASDAVANSQPFASHLLAQLGHPGLLTSALLMAVGAAAASRLVRGHWR